MKCLTIALIALASVSITAFALDNIQTSSNETHFNIPDWMPKSCGTTKTPGSSSFDYHSAITTNDAASLYAVLNGYCERCYKLNRGQRNQWNTQIYGPTVPAWFQCPADLGDRSIPPTRAIEGLTRMSAISGKIPFDNFYCYRPGWYSSDGKFSVSSSRLMKDINKGSGYDPDWVPLDNTAMPYFDWKSSPQFGDLWPNQLFIGLKNFYPDGIYNSDAGPGAGFGPGWTRSICVDALTDISFGYDIATWSGHTAGLTAVGSTFAESMKHQFGDGCNVYTAVSSPTNALLAPRPWISETGRILSMMDRAYTSTRIPNAVTGETTYYSVYRTASCSKPNVRYEFAGGDLVDADIVYVSDSDWEVSSMKTIPPSVSNTLYTGNHAVEVCISDQNYGRGPLSSYVQIGSMSYEYTVSNFFADIEGLYPSGVDKDISFEFEGLTPSEKTLPSKFQLKLNPNCPYHGMPDGTYYVNPRFDTFLVKAYSVSKSKSGRGDYSGSIRPEGTGQYSLFSSVLAHDGNTDVCGPMPPDGYTNLTMRWKAERGNIASVSVMSNAVEALLSNAREKIEEVGISRWGNFEEPSSYAHISPEEVKVQGRAVDGIGLEFPKGIFTAHITTPESGSFVEKGTMTDLKYEGVPVSSGNVIMTYTGHALFIINATNMTPVVTKPARSGYADAVLFQRVDLTNPDSLKPSDGPGGSSITVSFNTDYAEDASPITTNRGYGVVCPSNLVRYNPSIGGFDDQAFSLEGWYRNASKTTRYTNGDPIYNNITLYAKWNDNRVISIASEPHVITKYPGMCSFSVNVLPYTTKIGLSHHSIGSFFIRTRSYVKPKTSATTITVNEIPPASVSYPELFFDNNIASIVSETTGPWEGQIVSLGPDGTEVASDWFDISVTIHTDP